MSINVTVKGNPININSGTKFSEDSEVKKRRQIRLQQVRQQSKDIAQNIRDKVKKEHEKQTSQTAHDNATKLKQWQNKKLLQLQSQYQAGLNEIGLGHIQAAEEEKLEENVLVEKERRKRGTKVRGLQAAQKLQIAKNEQNMKKALPIQHKKTARDIEDARAAMISQLKSRKKLIEAENRAPVLNVDLEAEDLDDILNHLADETATNNTETNSGEEDSVVITTTIKSPKKHRSKDVPEITSKSKPMNSVPQSSKLLEQGAAVNEYREEENLLRTSSKTATDVDIRQFYLDTRISDRIKNRLLPSPKTKKFVCGSTYDFENMPQKSVCCPCPDKNIESAHVSVKDKPLDLNTHTDEHDVPSKSTVNGKAALRSIKNQSKASQRSKDKDRNTTSTLNQPVVSEKTKGIEVPLKPPVALISSNETLSHQHSLPPQPTNISRVQYYDHRNRYNTEYLTDNANIQKVADENIVRLADPVDNSLEDTELRLRRDREAQIRGQKAIEKERIHREYKEMLQKLPILQKQERIACLCRDKPTFHMNKERLQEVELRRQNVMENVYENLFKVQTHAPKLKVIPDPNNMPFRTIHIPDSTSLESGENKEKESKTGFDENQTNLLQILLTNLQQQKEMLQQLGSSKQQSSEVFGNKISSKNIDKRLSECECIAVKALILQNTSTQTSPAPTSRTSTTNVDVAVSPKRPHISISNEADESSAPKKLKKIRKKVQTDPENKAFSVKSTSSPRDKIINKSSVSSDNTDLSSPVRIRKPDNAKHKCNCEPHADHNQLCEIRIRIQENEKPEIIITSPQKSKNARVESHSAKPALNVPTYSEPSPKFDLKAPSVSDRKRSKTTDKRITPKRVAVNNTIITWNEHFTQNSTSSSTTYYSPPTMQQPRVAKGTTKSKSIDASGLCPKKIDHRLMTYISKLLDLSKAQIDELNISSVSEVTTPNSSIIECPNNRPMKQLMNVMKLFKLSPLDIATNLNYSKESSRVGSINSNNTTTGTTGGCDSQVQYRDLSVSSKYSSDNSKNTTESGGFLTKYTEMTNICHQRISDLTAEIEKIRREKQQILENHSESDKENSTIYCNLPSQFGPNSNQPVSPHSLDEQEELNKKLLRIRSPTKSDYIAADMDYDEFFIGVDDVDKDIMERYIKLKTDINKLIVDVPETLEGPSHILLKDSDKPQALSSQFLEEQIQLRNRIIQTTDPPVETRVATTNDIVSVGNADGDILNTLLNAKTDVNELTVEVPKPLKKDLKIKTEARQDLFFVPMFDDIPRLPKFGTSHVLDVGKRPPPSKGLIAARKFKGDIIAPPHELSTIAEADSLISTKFTLKQTLDASYVEDDMKQTKTSYIKSCSASTSSEDSMPDLLAELIGKVNVTDDFKEDITKRSDTDTSTEKSDLETIESMLRSIGMDWAIATLRKTREALDRNSSSSSVTELSIKQSDCPMVNGSSTGSQYSSQSGSSTTFGKEIDLSQISGGTSNTVDKYNRTSTPVSKRKCKSKIKDAINTDDSDLASVQENTDDQYLTIPDVSLKSHNRTK